MFTSPAPGSDEWVANRLASDLEKRNRGASRATHSMSGVYGRRFVRSGIPADQRVGLRELYDYYRGEPPMPWVPDGWSDSVVAYLRLARLNVAEVPVSSVVDAMVPLAWGTATEDDADGDRIAAEVAAENDLPVVIADAAQSMLLYGDGYALIGASAGGEIPPITAEDPRHCITREDPVTRRTQYGLKSSVDDWTGEKSWHLYGYDERGGWVRKAVTSPKGRRWVSSPGFGEGREYIPGHGKWCAMHRVRNRDGVGEFERHLDAIDRINDGLFSRITIAKHQAYRQRAIKGLPDTEVDPATNAVREIDYSDMFRADPGALWRLPDGAEIWESQQVDLGPLRMSMIDDVKHFCALTHSPIYYLFPDEQQSAAGAVNQSQSHEKRVEDRRRRIEGLQFALLAHAFEAMGEKGRADVGRMRVEWAPVRRYSLQEQAAALPAFKAGGVPWAERMIKVMQVRPSELGRLRAMRDEDAILEAAALPAPGVGAGSA